VTWLAAVFVTVIRPHDFFVENDLYRLADILDWYVCTYVQRWQLSLGPYCDHGVATEHTINLECIKDLDGGFTGRLYLSHLPVAVGTHFIFKMAHTRHAEFRGCLLCLKLDSISDVVDLALSGAGSLTANDDVASDSIWPLGHQGPD
jgi:hypothetical protein